MHFRPPVPELIEPEHFFLAQASPLLLCQPHEFVVLICELGLCTPGFFPWENYSLRGVSHDDDAPYTSNEHQLQNGSENDTDQVVETVG